MVSVADVQQRSPSSETVAVVVANALPLVGVGALGWDLTALVFLYWFELGIVALWALIRAAFAGRPSEFESSPLIAGALASKRTAIPVPFTELGIRLSTLPALVVVIPILALVWFFAGVTTVGVVGPETLPPDTLETVTVASVSIFLSEGASTCVEYLYRGEYREHSAQTAIRGAFIRVAVIGVGGLITATAVGLGVSSVPADASITAIDPAVVGPPVLVGIVLVKFGFDLGGVYRERLAAFDEASYVEFGWAYEPPSDESIAPAGAGADRLRPTIGGRLCGGVSVSNLRRHPGAVVIAGFPFLVALLFAMGQAWDIVLMLVATSVVVPLGLLTADYWLRYGGVEYRMSEDAVVAYDRLFRTRLWRIESGNDFEIRVERGRFHRWLDTSTVVVERADEEFWIPHVRDPAPIHEMFGVVSSSRGRRAVCR